MVESLILIIKLTIGWLIGISLFLDGFDRLENFLFIITKPKLMILSYQVGYTILINHLSRWERVEKKNLLLLLYNVYLSRSVGVGTHWTYISSYFKSNDIFQITKIVWIKFYIFVLLSWFGKSEFCEVNINLSRFVVL